MRYRAYKPRTGVNIVDNTLYNGQIPILQKNTNFITSNKSLTCLQLVFTSNWSNFWHAFDSRSRGFVSDSWAFLLGVCFGYMGGGKFPWAD